MESIDCLVIGAGVVGLAVARALAQQGHEVVVAEAERLYGSGVSSRNSEVIHAGIYYPAGSLKATLCVRGNRLLYDFCASHGVPHRRCGKLVVATREADDTRLESIRHHAAANGVMLQPLSQAAAQALEPALHCTAALASDTSGIVDSHALMTALLGDAEDAGAMLALKSPIEDAEALNDGRWRVRSGGDEAMRLDARWVINCAGLAAQHVASRMQGFPAAQVPMQHLAKGHYFALAARAPFARLIYPTPVDGGLGVHLTLDLAGAARFGPDVQWWPPGTALDFDVDPARRAGFEADIRRYWPSLPEDALVPAYTGMRPKLSGPGEPAADFHIAGPAQHGTPGVVQLFGIESPGLTASLAIGEHVAAIVQQQG